MKIGLIDVDSKIPNLALMKISAWYKQHGEQVEWFKPLFEAEYDLIYASQIFTNSKPKYLPKRAIGGGSGINLQKKLDPAIEHIYPDYTLYNIDYAMGFLTRGCINQCPFCIETKKEGPLHKNALLEEFWLNQKKIMLLDNALTDYIDAESELCRIRDLGLRLNLTQGFNVRTLTPAVARALAGVRLWDKDSQWHFAWDFPTDEKQVLNGIQILQTAGIPTWRMMCYILVGFNTSPKEDLYRIQTLEKIGVDTFVIRFKRTPYTNALAKWCNRKPLMKSCSFKKYAQTRKDRAQIKIEG